MANKQKNIYSGNSIIIKEKKRKTNFYKMRNKNNVLMTKKTISIYTCIE